jgi:hypothetical protein
VFGIPSLQVANPMNADIVEQKGNFWANAGNGCKISRFHHLVVLTVLLVGIFSIYYDFDDFTDTKRISQGFLGVKSWCMLSQIPY